VEIRKKRREEEEEEEEEERMDLYTSPPRSVVSIDSIAANADFISLDY
jgi:hypothetical protein